MDPASIVGLVAACSSLTKMCASVVKTLHDLAETYKTAELAILSILQECETVHFAWDQIEQWANRNPNTVGNFHRLRDQLQRSIYCGELVMSALETDLAKMIPQSGNFRRHAALVWNDALFRDHQTRIHNQVQALQLLLQIISLPRDEERLEILTIREKVFHDADESARSIVPSDLSSRLSCVQSDTSSVRTIRNSALKYTPFSFDHDLFTSYVYKRNYRLPIKQNPTRPSRDAHATSVSDQQEFVPPHGYVLEEPRRPALPKERLEELYLAPDIVVHKDGFPDRERYDDPLIHCKSGLYDVATLFHRDSETSLATAMAFLKRLYFFHLEFFSISIQRIVYATGTEWLKTFVRLATFVPREVPSSHSRIWRNIRIAATACDDAKSNASSSDVIPCALEIACDQQNGPVVKYLLRCGHFLARSSDIQSLGITLPGKHPVEMGILSSWLGLGKIWLAVLLWTIPSGFEHYRILSSSYWDVVQDLREWMAPCGQVVYQGTEYPIIFATLLLFDDNNTDPLFGAKIIQSLLYWGADPRCAGWVILGNPPKRYYTALELAVQLGQTNVVKILIKYK